MSLRAPSAVSWPPAPRLHALSSTPSLPASPCPAAACGKLHRVSVLTITDAGDSDIVSQM